MSGVHTIWFYGYHLWTIEADDIRNTNSSLLKIEKAINQLFNNDNANAPWIVHYAAFSWQLVHLVINMSNKVLQAKFHKPYNLTFIY